ncbi:MAG: TonB-dependent receptor [Bacteroidota bacterium]
MMKYKNIFLLLLCLYLSNNSIAQQLYTGTIIDGKTSEPLVGATISTSQTGVSISNYNGQFEFRLEEQPEEFYISYIGYKTLTIVPEKLMGVVRLAPSPSELNQIIVSANRAAQERADAPISISTISAQLLEDSKPTRLDEVLNKVSGVYMVDLGNEQHTMAIRQPINYKGLFLYLEDGLPIRPTGVFNHNALLEMNMAALNRIEIIRGPASSSYGSEAIGGAINFVTLRPAAVPTGRISLQGNNIGYRRIDLNASNTFGKLGVGVSAYYAERREGFREHSDFDKLALTFRADYLINDKNAITFDATYIDYYADMTGSLDSSFFYGQDYTSSQTFTNRAVDALRTKLTYSHYWDDNSKTTIAAFARDNSIRQNPSYRVRDDYSSWGNPNGNRNLAHGEINDNSVTSFGFVAQHKQSLNLLRGANLTIGTSLDNSPNTFEANYIAITKSEENIYTDFTRTDSVLTDYKVDLVNFGTYANFDIKLTDQLQFTVALRYDKLNFDFKNNLDENAFSGAPDDVDNFSALTPKLGLTYQLGKGKGLYANYSQGFLPPQVSELYRGVKIPVLQPAEFNNFEIGGWFQLGSKVSLDLSLYQLDGKNEIISVRLDDGTRENRNAGKTQHRGIEYGINWQLIDGLQLRFSGTNASHRFIDYIENGNDYSDNEMGQAPSWIANAELTYKPSFVPGLRLAFEWQHIDEYYMDNGNSAKYDGYDIFNFRIGYRFRQFEFWSNVMNLSDKLYATVARRSRWGDSYSVGEPRAINIGLAYNFQKK